MVHSATAITAPLLQADEPPPFEIINENGASRALLVCEHGGVTVPRQLKTLGLSPEHFTRHYALDIGVRRVTQTLAQILDASAIIANYSRLVVDLNRAVDHPTTFAPSGEGTPVPGNIAMSAEDRALRLAEIYDPFHTALQGMIDRRVAEGRLPSVISIHSFTPVFFGQKRPWEIGMLWVNDTRLPQPMIDWFRDKGFAVGDNEPYDARAMGGTTVNRHGDDRRLANVLVEIRNDLIGNDEKSDSWAKMLGDCLKTVLDSPALDGYYEGPQHVFDPEQGHSYFERLVDHVRQQDS
jgi:predicted N-formylglutamate amidohydrolase